MILSIVIFGVICIVIGIYMVYIFIKGADIRNGNQEAANRFDDEQAEILAQMRESL